MLRAHAPVEGIQPPATPVVWAILVWRVEDKLLPGSLSSTPDCVCSRGWRQAAPAARPPRRILVESIPVKLGPIHLKAFVSCVARHHPLATTESATALPLVPPGIGFPGSYLPRSPTLHRLPGRSSHAHRSSHRAGGVLPRLVLSCARNRCGLSIWVPSVRVCYHPTNRGTPQGLSSPGDGHSKGLGRPLAFSGQNVEAARLPAL